MRRIIAISVCLTLVSLQAMAQPIELATEKGTLEETFRESARISGSLLVGAQRAGSGETDVGIAAEIPEEWAGDTVCVRVVSVDGLYAASNPYRISTGWSGGAAQFPYPTAHHDFLAGRPDGAIGVRVTRSPCDAPEGEVALASWRGASGAPTLLLNSFGAEAVFAYVGGSATPVRCTSMGLPGQSAYDVGCSLDAALSQGDESSIEILRIVKGKAAPQHTIDLRLIGQ